MTEDSLQNGVYVVYKWIRMWWFWLLEDRYGAKINQTPKSGQCSLAMHYGQLFIL